VGLRSAFVSSITTPLPPPAVTPSWPRRTTLRRFTTTRRASQADFNGQSGQNAKSQNDWTPVPNFFYTYSPSNFPVSFGVGYYMPYGLSFDWPSDGPFRTTTTFGELQYNTVNPIVAWEVVKNLTIAAGPTINWASTDLQRGIAAPGDEFKFTGNAFAMGATAGLRWQPLTKHAFGLSYRSRTTMQLDGKSEVKPYPVPKQDASTDLPLPQVFIVGYSFRPTPLWNLEVNFDWADWDVVNTPVLKQATGNVPLPLQWESSYAIEFGATRYFENGLHVSGGYVFIQNSVPNKTYTPLVPDQDLHVFSAGVGGQYRHWNWDLAYQFSYGPGREVSGSVYGPTVAGEYTWVANAISLTVGFHF
jgi:long-chain fatty acid transport protein